MTAYYILMALGLAIIIIVSVLEIKWVKRYDNFTHTLITQNDLLKDRNTLLAERNKMLSERNRILVDAIRHGYSAGKDEK